VDNEAGKTPVHESALVSAGPKVMQEICHRHMLLLVEQLHIDVAEPRLAVTHPEAHVRMTGSGSRQRFASQTQSDTDQKQNDGFHDAGGASAQSSMTVSKAADCLSAICSLWYGVHTRVRVGEIGRPILNDPFSIGRLRLSSLGTTAQRSASSLMKMFLN